MKKTTRIALKVLAVAFALVMLWVLFQLRGEPQCQNDPPFFLNGTVYDCGARD